MSIKAHRQRSRCSISQNFLEALGCVNWLTRGTVIRHFLRDIIQCCFTHFHRVITAWHNILHVCSSLLMFRFPPVNKYTFTVRWNYVSDICMYFREFRTERQECTCFLIRNIPHQIFPSTTHSQETEKGKCFWSSSI